MYNSFYTPSTSPQQSLQATTGIFTTFVENAEVVKNYPVPVGGMVILIDLQGSKMWFKSTNINGVPAPIRTFDIKELLPPPPANVNAVTREEFDAISKKLDTLINALQKTQEGSNVA